MKLTPDVTKFLRNTDGSIHQLSDLKQITVDSLYKNVTEICFEDNYYAPGGWGQCHQGLKVMQDSIQMMSRYSSRWQLYEELFKKYVFGRDQIKMLGTFLFNEAKSSNHQRIVVVFVDKGYLHPKTEIHYLLNFFKQQKIDVLLMHVLDVLKEIESGRLKAEDHLFYCYYNDAEVKTLCKQQDLDFSEVWYGAQNIGILIPSK